MGKVRKGVWIFAAVILICGLVLIAIARQFILESANQQFENLSNKMEPQ